VGVILLNVHLHVVTRHLTSVWELFCSMTTCMWWHGISHLYGNYFAQCPPACGDTASDICVVIILLNVHLHVVIRHLTSVWESFCSMSTCMWWHGIWHLCGNHFAQCPPACGDTASVWKSLSSVSTCMWWHSIWHLCGNHFAQCPPACGDRASVWELLSSVSTCMWWHGICMGTKFPYAQYPPLSVATCGAYPPACGAYPPACGAYPPSCGDVSMTAHDTCIHFVLTHIYRVHTFCWPIYIWPFRQPCRHAQSWRSPNSKMTFWHTHKDTHTDTQTHTHTHAHTHTHTHRHTHRHHLRRQASDRILTDHTIMPSSHSPDCSTCLESYMCTNIRCAYGIFSPDCMPIGVQGRWWMVLVKPCIAAIAQPWLYAHWCSGELMNGTSKALHSRHCTALIVCLLVFRGADEWC
jgi:hypothetical protein